MPLVRVAQFQFQQFQETVVQSWVFGFVCNPNVARWESGSQLVGQGPKKSCDINFRES